jgi:hypothetical protein
MLKDIMLFIKYPYTAGVIGTLWLGSAILMAINSSLNGVNVVIINLAATIIIAAIGFGGREG